MNNTVRTILIVALVVVLGAGLFYGGMYFASTRYGYAPYGMMGGYGSGGMMGNYGYNNPNNSSYGYGPGMMGGMMNGGMMGGPGYGGLSNIKPISVQDARTAIESYLGVLGNDELAIKEIMIFDNGAYAIVEEKSTGIGAFELLVDPVGLSVFPEYGPNMMWNLKYGMMSGSNSYGSGMMGGGGMMMRGWYGNNVQVPDVSADMFVSAKEATQTAQKYLDTYLPGVKVSDEVTAFYGYYTIDVERDGKIIGMLSVNGYTKQVFLHTWHGNFIEMSE
jgi:hypothetical protein